MKKTRGFLLTAGIVLATAFTLSCSSGDDPDNTGGSGTIPDPIPDAKGNQTYAIPGAQVYVLSKEGTASQYSGKLRVTLYETTIQIGTIDGGKLTLNLQEISGSGRQWFSAGSCDLNLIGTPNGISNIASGDNITTVDFYYAQTKGESDDPDIGPLVLEKGWNFVYDVNRTYTVTKPDLTYDWFISNTRCEND